MRKPFKDTLANGIKENVSMSEFISTEETIIYDEVKAARSFREKGENDLCIKALSESLAKVSAQSSPHLYNMLLNEIEISRGLSIIESKPRGLGVALTNRCNIRCIMCSVWNNPWDLPEKAVREVMELLPYLERIFWQGGEVFLYPYFEELFEKVISYPHVRQDLNTNGLLIDEKWAKNLVKANANIIISIDGVTKETYEHIRKGAQFSRLLKSIDLLNEHMDKAKITGTEKKRSSIVINLVVMRSNYRELGDFIDFAKKYRFERLQITPVDLNDKENIFLYKDRDALDHISKTIPELLMKAKDYGITVSNWLPPLEGLHEVKENKPAEENFPPGTDSRKVSNKISCYWPWQFMFIDWGGRARPQCFCRKALGNIHENSILDIWNNPMMQAYRQKLLNNDLENWCDARCSSGCMPEESLGMD
jgi:MoaA/NifB/PqqE/SkfB family radical SAM enzyme